MAFISDEISNEDEKYLATLWLDKFVSYRDAYPPRDDTNKRGSKQVDRYIPPSIKEGHLKVVKNREGSLKVVKTRATPVTSSHSRVIEATESSLQSPSLEKPVDQNKSSTPGLVLSERIINDWKKRFQIAFNQLHAVQDGDQNR